MKLRKIGAKLNIVSTILKFCSTIIDVRAKLIALEGADRSGKKTQTFLLADHLSHLSLNGRYSHKVKLIEIPTESRFTYHLVYKMLYNGTAKKYPNLFQCLMFLNKFWLQISYLFWAQFFYDYIILDRWALSAIVYGDCTNVNKTFNRILYWFLIVPDLTIILNGLPHFRNEEKDSYETDNELQTNVRRKYDEWMFQERKKENVVRIDNHGTKDEVFKKVLMVI